MTSLPQRLMLLLSALLTPCGLAQADSIFAMGNSLTSTELATPASHSLATQATIPAPSPLGGTIVPEPGLATLWLLGMVALGATRR